MRTQSVKTSPRTAKSAKRSVKKAVKRLPASAAKSVSSAKSSARGKVTRGPASPVVRVTQMPVGIDVAMMLNVRAPRPPVQPDIVDDVRLPHKYRVGETVYYNSPLLGRSSASGNYIVVKQLPYEGDDCQYRIKSAGEAFERVARESQLDRI